MTNSARKWNTNTENKLNKKRKWRKNIIRTACWNIMSWNPKNSEILLEMEQHNIDICALSETKRKGKGTIKVPNYVLIYSGVDKHKRATAGVGLLIAEKYEHLIQDIQYVNERILKVSLDIGTGNLNLISAYAPDMGKSREETDTFYESLENELRNIPVNEKLLIMGDLNARIGNNILPGIKHHFNEEHINENGEVLVDLCARYNMRINNTFFKHKPQHKITWQNSRGQNSTIDYIISNRAIHPTQILDTRSLTSANIGSDHLLVVCKLRINIQKKKIPKNTTQEKINIESIRDPTTKALYQTRLVQKIEANNIKEHDDTENCWKKIKTNITDAAVEALGLRKVGANKNPRNKQWYTPEVKVLAKEKREAYLRYRNNKTPEEKNHYIQTRNRVNAEIRNIKRNFWEGFTSEMEHDLYGAQKKVWKMLRKRKLEVVEYTQTQQIDETRWKTYFEQLYADAPEGEDEEEEEDEKIEEPLEITDEMTIEHAKKIKSRKAPGLDNIPNELLKYGGQQLTAELTKLFNKILTTKEVPNEWKKSITIPIFKKGDKKSPENYRGITLLSSTMKLFTKIIEAIISEYVNISEEQQGFRKNRSTVDAIFIVRQIVEKAIEYGKPAFMCFIDLTKAYDRVRLKHVVDTLKRKHVPKNIIDTIKQLNHNTATHILVNQKLTEEIQTPTGIRQGDSLSPQLFNLIMDEIITHIRDMKEGYSLTTGKINIVCYADDAVIVAENENDLQRLLHSFYAKAKVLNMQVSTTKTKTLVISKEPVRCKLTLENKTIEQVMSLNYLGIQITSCQNRTNEVKDQANKASRISGALRDIIWNNAFMSKKAKVRIYKTCVRPTLTYAIETRADNKRTKSILRTTEMKILRNISGYTLRHRKRNTDIRHECEVEDIIRWGRKRRRAWRDHVERMTEERLARIARDGRPRTRRPLGRPPKRWIESWTSASQEN